MLSASKIVREQTYSALVAAGFAVYDTVSPADAPDTHVILGNLLGSELPTNCEKTFSHDFQVEVITSQITGFSRTLCDTESEKVLSALKGKRFETPTAIVTFMQVNRYDDAPSFLEADNVARKIINFEIVTEVK